ncbi:MAG: hypothetical protein K9L95_01355 [Candidatus Omnitrophica bacterium]|nr:hypothetical protein [Candidatus Omnitrophota bacterium]MCF7876807.1 hypothetical protein [Candidatus Omnitrophota bacterium]MCF7878102.1 hypothetical protein [Candidatus Omnitrophota bacterium]MCF7892994.1 hypothetical protein [Candidatus Omnitrophota bacterium]
MVKKGFILVIVFVVLIVISFLALAAINLMRQQTHLTEHSIKRSKGLLAAQAGLAHAMEELKKGNDPSGNNVLNINGLSVDINYANDNSGPGGTDPVIITVNN